MNNPLVSVIIPNYNHERFLEQRIESVLNQTYENLEVIILDDCSLDNSRKIIQSYKEHEKIVHIEFNTQNSGSTFKQWEKGFKLAKGDLIWIAESDDLADSRFLENLVPSFKNPQVVLTFCKSLIIDTNGTAAKYQNAFYLPNVLQDLIFKQDFVKEGSDFVKSNMLKENQIPNASAVVFRKNSLENLDLNSFLNYHLYGDWFFWVLLILNGKIHYKSNILNSFRVHLGTVREAKAKELSTFFEHVKLYKVLSGYFPSLRAELLDRLIYKYQTYFIKNVNLLTHFKIHWCLLRIYYKHPIIYIRTLMKKK